MSQQHGAFPPSAQVYAGRRHNAEQAALPFSIRVQELAPQDTSGLASSSSTPLSPMFSPTVNGHLSQNSSAMTTRQYNPQQWGQSVIGASHVAFSPIERIAREATGMEASMPSPPPPYTPPPDGAYRLTRPSIANHFVPSPLPIEPSSYNMTQISTPPTVPSAHFPPPPGSSSRDRSSSGVGRDSQRSRFSISGLAARVKRSDSSDQISTLSTLHNQVVTMPAGPSSRPPASRRAVSTGAITTHTPAQLPVGRVSPGNSQWEPGMPLPPPPPGPPPPNHRSQSLSRYARRAPEIEDESCNSNVVLRPPPAPPTRRRHEDTLGAIPPTPSDWNPDDTLADYPELRVDTGHQKRKQALGGSRGHDTEPVTDSIRERRSRSRAKREGQEPIKQSRSRDEADLQNDMHELVKPINLTLASAEGLLRRRRAVTAECSPSQSSPAQPSSPEFSRRQKHGRNNLTVLTPPYTPSIAAPLESKASDPTLTSDKPMSTQSIRLDNSQVLKNESLVEEANTTVAPSPAGLSAFTQASLDRYQRFVLQESNAQSDQERLEIFANFIVHESRLRRGQYHEAFKAMAGDIMELTRDMWRPLPLAPDIDPLRSRCPSPESANIMIDLDGSFHTSVSSTAELTPATDIESLADESLDVVDKRPSNPWGDKFQPCLSPIPSMAVSTVPDEESSRGRSASRWWEESVDGSFGNGGRKLERTKQEEKYMSLHPQELYISTQHSPNQSTPTPGTSKRTFQYGPDEYPTEKVGWHEDEAMRTPSNPRSAGLTSPRNKAPMGRFTGKPAIDVTRLVTLPPPYPRHYPAVSNSHPALSVLRANHRAVADLSSIREIIRSHESVEANRRQAWRTSAGERLRHFRSHTQASINTGKIAYNDATQAELVFRQSEAATVLEQAETQSQDFRQRVHEPVCRMLAEHLRHCDDYIGQVVQILETEASSDQNLLAQTEGDERPELVEQLTLLKWLFESREHIYKERFDMDTALRARESAAMLTGYQQSQTEEQNRQLEWHFESERQKRQLCYAQETTQRFDHLRKIVERHISRGVEIQLSAFWDIAPGLIEVVHKVPHDLNGFEVVVPANELAENVSYHEFPLQYMYTTLVHAKKSTYQFIEAQTNLLCLLHEVHTATESASLRLQEIERVTAGENAARVQAEMVRARKIKEQELTGDLQGKVREVEGQWREALGVAIEDCIERVRSFLEKTGGWEDSLDM